MTAKKVIEDGEHDAAKRDHAFLANSFSLSHSDPLGLLVRGPLSGEGSGYRFFKPAGEGDRQS
jgi:hypothetical protein